MGIICTAAHEWLNFYVIRCIPGPSKGCQLVPFQGVNSPFVRVSLAPKLEGAYTSPTDLLTGMDPASLPPEKTNTLPETNIAPENGWLEDVSFWEGLLAGAMLVSGSVHFP